MSGASTGTRAELGFLSRATLVSIVATGIEFLILPGVGRLMPHWAAYASVQVVANLVTFLLYKYWAFDAAKRGSIGRQYFRQAIVFGGSFLFNTGVSSLIEYRGGLGIVTSFLISNVMVYPLWNYPLNRWWVFHERMDAPATPPLSSQNG